MKIHDILIAVFFVAAPVVAAAESTMTEQQRVEAMRELHWLPASTYNLPASDSSLALPDGYHIVLGKDARRLVTLSGDPADSTVEAAAFSPHFDDEVIFQSVKEGYVALDDWKEVDTDAMIKEIRDNTEEANKYRKEQGSEKIRVVGWLQQPTLDRQTSTVYWAIEGATNTGRVANSIGLRLGRNGYERLNWIVDKADYVPVGGQLDVMLRAHSFHAGARYSDYIAGIKRRPTPSLAWLPRLQELR